MTRALTSLGWTTASLTSLILVGTVAAQSPSAAPQASWMQRTFSDGLKRLGLLFSDIGSLAGGPATGEVWQVDKRTGERRRIGAASDLSWPAPSPDGSAAYTLRGRQVLRIAISGGQETLVGVPADLAQIARRSPGRHGYRLRRRRSISAPCAAQPRRGTHGSASVGRRRAAQTDRRPLAGSARLCRRRAARGAGFGARRARPRRVLDRRRERTESDRLRR
jgi:hypothetical protein